VRIARALVVAADSLAALPAKDRPGRMPDTRELVGRELSAVPPYVVVYRVDEVTGVVRILRVWHTSQNR